MNEEESVLGLLYKQMEVEKAEIAQALIEGAAPDFAQYKELCGKVYGLALAQSFVNTMADKLRRQAE